MRKINFTLLLLFTISIIYANPAKQNKEPSLLPIDLSKDALYEKETLPKGDYKITITSDFNCDEYDVTTTFKITNRINEPLDTSYIKKTSKATKSNEEDSKTDCTYSGSKGFKMKKRTLIELTIIVVEKSDNSKKTYTRIYEPIISFQWVTSIGVSAISLINSDTYKTTNTAEGIKVVKDGSQKTLQSVPILQFSYINLEKDTSFGFMGGIGVDIDNLSAFAGGTFYVGYNLFLSAGLAFHKQLRLGNQYNKNDIVPEEIPTTDLNKEYYRINPFVSLTFRLDQNLFKK